MNISVTLLNLAGAIALLLWGTHMVQSGIQRTFGPKLRSVLGNALKSQPRAFLAGLGVTAVLQSSTATGLMVSGFAAAGLVDLVPALAVMLGANVGTTLIVQVLSFDGAAFSPALILVGVMMFRRGSVERTRDIGRVFIGLGLMLLALHQLLELMTPYEDAPSLRMFLGAVATIPLIDVLLAAVVTWAAHSSVAVILLIMSFASKGVVPPEAAFALVLGANIGSAINPVLEGASGGGAAARRLPVGNLLNRIFGTVIALAFLGPIGELMVVLQPDNGRAVADFHTLFNLALALLFFPVLGPFAKLLEKLMPAHVDLADPARPLYLDPAAREVPVVALGAAAREAMRLADLLDAMLKDAQAAVVNGDLSHVAQVKRNEDIIDSLNSAIRSYLTGLDPHDLSEADQARLQRVLTFSTQMEQAGDMVESNLLIHADKRVKRGLAFSPQSEADVRALMERLSTNLRLASSLFMTEDPRAARMLAEEKSVFRNAEAEGTKSHLERMRDGQTDSIETSSLHLDLLSDMKQINSHIVAAAAYPVLEQSGDLLPSRIASDSA
ncbi:MAG TPA: Na/Pi cotransporter family protein [Xanthobacteraceae bacterium]|jgi:phosphate:Na+ symporter|uniref:Na/Pi cotransporter family protein n=1 Tax=Roseixanthobacter finlandensis TaxID=3119922 RepID=UPI002C4DF5DF|nr:Na/Pi cotransporter family protein [Xanthobacteraceae bacterium]HQS45816.1 Na/Pi cotransporter family protein [Xanthobacteraceae bacterium]